MNEKNKNIVINTLFVTIITAFLVIIYFVAPSLAWFTDEDDFENEGEVAQIEISLLDDNNTVLTSFSTFTYNGSQTYNLTIKATNTEASTIGAIVRVIISAFWEDGLPVYTDLDEGVETNEDFTIQYTYNSSVWQQKNVNGLDYYYYNATLMPNEVVNFLSQITFPTLPSAYVGKTITLFAQVEGLQANNAGVALWATNAPINWAPLS